MAEQTGDRAQVTGPRKSSALRLGGDIAERLLRLAVAVVHATGQLPRNAAGRHVGPQLVRSVTGAGANYEEARAAESRDDFIHKVFVAAKELREAIYWLRFIELSGWTNV